MTTKYEYNNPSYSGGNNFWNGYHEAQTFTVGATGHTITSVKLMLSKTGADTTSTLYVLIKAVDVNHKPTGNTLASGTKSFADIPQSSFNLIEITLTSEYTLTANTEYAIEYYNNASSPTCLVTPIPSPSTYPDGLWGQYETSWTMYSVYDTYFEVWGNALASIPTVTTQEASSIDVHQATLNGTVTNTGGANCTKRGICWNLTGTPTVTDSKTEETGDFGIGTFTEAMTSLLRGTLYYVRAYAYNPAGYGYGNEVTFTTDSGYLALTGDTNYIYVAGGGTYANILKKVDGSGDMGVNSTHTLTNGREIRGIAQSGDYIYVTCLQDGAGASSPRVIKLAKSDWTETVKTLSAIGGDNADSVGPIALDGTNLIIGGSVSTAKAAFWIIAITDFSTITASYKYTTFQDNRVYEDLKGFTETDPGTRIDVLHHNYLDFVANTSEDGRVTKDYGVGHFGNFTHKFKFCIDSSAEGANAYPYLLAVDTLDDAKGLHDASKIFIGVRVTQDGASSYKLYLHEDNAGTAYEDTALTIALTTFYFCKLVKSTTSLTLEVYSTQTLLDAGGSGDLGSKTLTLHANHTFRYLYAGDTYNDGTNKTCDLDIENFAIGEVTTPGQIEDFYIDATNIYAFTTNGMIYKITKADGVLNANNNLIPTGSSHIPKPFSFFYAGAKPWNDLYWVTGCTFKHLLKLRTGNVGIESDLADSDADWTSFNCVIGSGDYLYIGSGNINEIKKIIIASLSVDSTLALSTGTTGINALWSN